MIVRVYAKPTSYILHNDGQWYAELRSIDVDKSRALAESYFNFGYDLFACVPDPNNDPFQNETNRPNDT